MVEFNSEQQQHFSKCFHHLIVYRHVACSLSVFCLRDLKVSQHQLRIEERKADNTPAAVVNQKLEMRWKCFSASAVNQFVIFVLNNEWLAVYKHKQPGRKSEAVIKKCVFVESWEVKLAH